MLPVLKRILIGTAYTSFEKVSVQLLSLVSFFLIVNNLSLKDFGLLQLLFTVVGPAATISMIGMERIAVSDGAVYRAEKAYATVSRFFREYAVVTTSLLLVVFVCSWFFRGFLSRYYDADLTFFYWSLVFLIIGQIGMNFTSVIFETYEKFNYSLLSKFCESFGRMIVILILFFWFGFTLSSVLWAYVIGKLFATLVSIPLAYMVIAVPSTDVAPRGVLWGIIRKHGKWEMVSQILGTIAGSIAPWVVKVFISTEAVALFAFVQKVNTLCVSIFPIRSVLFPILSHSIRKNRETAALVATKIKKYLLIAYFAFYVVIFLGIDTVIFYLAPQYQSVAWLVKLTMLHLFVDILTLGQSIVLYALKKQKINFFLTSYGIVTTLLSQIVFTYLWGLGGLVLSWLFVGVTLGLLREYVLRTRLHYSLLHMRELFTYDYYDRFLITYLRTWVVTLWRKIRRVAT